jgi:hypothetical protein
MNQIKYLKRKYGTKNKFLSKVTGISEPRLSRLSKLDNDEYIAKVYADEYIKLNRIIEAE